VVPVGDVTGTGTAGEGTETETERGIGIGRGLTGGTETETETGTAEGAGEFPGAAAGVGVAGAGAPLQGDGAVAPLAALPGSREDRGRRPQAAAVRPLPVAAAAVAATLPDRLRGSVGVPDAETGTWTVGKKIERERGGGAVQVLSNAFVVLSLSLCFFS